MRTNLQPLLGQRVVVVADYDGARRIRDTNYWCFKDCSLYTYNQHKRLDLTSPTTQTQHLWIQGDDRAIDLLEGGVFSGEVVAYTRADGTQDYGVVITASLFLPLVKRSVASLSAAVAAKVPVTYAERLVETLTDALTNGTTLIDPYGSKTPLQTARDLRETLLGVITNAKHQQRISVSFASRRKCRVSGARLADFSFPSRYKSLQHFA
jgi:hypothetical protein